MARTLGKTRDCNGCRFWSEMIAQAVGGRPVEAMCLSPDGPLKSTYTAGRQTCAGWKSGHHGAVDDPPNYGEEVRPLYEREAEAKYPNGAPMWNADGSMMLDENGNRSIFDDIDD